MLRTRRSELTADPQSAAWRSSIRRRLLAWYRKAARKLPWRGTRDPYRVWVSEIMLQQTQVATVAPYYRRFVRAFPNIGRLAKADEQQVLRLWEGLGYYRRARQLHQAARIVTDEHNGRFPCDPEAARRLPGIGRYTAGAILSIAFDVRQPILEANTVRLLSRLLAYEGDVSRADGQRRLWQFAEELLPGRDVGTFNQALMELGSLVCLPRNPRCDECPLRTVCPTRALGLQHAIPRPKSKPVVEQVHEAAVVVRRGQRVLVVQRADHERWAGMWDFPRFPTADASLNGHSSNGTNGAGDASQLADFLVRKVHEQTGVNVEVRKRLITIRHGVTRFRITLDCYAARYLSVKRSRKTALQPMKWLKPAELDLVPLSVTGRRIGCLLAAGK